LAKDIWKLGKICANQTGKSMLTDTDMILFVFQNLEMIRNGRKTDRPVGKNV